MEQIEKEIEQPENIIWAVGQKVEELKNQNLNEKDFDLKYQEIKDKFLKENPKERLGLELIFKIKDYVSAQDKIKSFGKNFLSYKELKEAKEEVIGLASWNQEATKFLIKHKYDDESAKLFWDTYKKVFNLFSEDEKSRDGVIKGIVGQASVYHVLDHSGFRPQVSTPQEDVFEKIDLKISSGKKDILIQVKQHHDASQPLVIGTKEIKYPSVSIKETNKNIHFSSYDIQEMTALQENCEEKSRRERKNIEAFYIVIPPKQCNKNTGRPSPKFLKEIKPLIRQSLNK